MHVKEYIVTNSHAKKYDFYHIFSVKIANFIKIHVYKSVHRNRFAPYFFCKNHKFYKKYIFIKCTS